MQGQKVTLTQGLSQKLSPQMIQAINLMVLPLVDLKAKIQEEIERNPALEIVEDRSTASLEELPPRQSEDYDYFADETSDSGYTNKYQKDGNQDLKRKFLEGTISRPESLQDHLLWQLRLQPITEEEFCIGEILISNLDKNGFYIQEPETLVQRIEIKMLYDMIRLIQTFDPLGVCSKDYREALLIQIEHHPHPVAHSYDAVEKYMKLLEKRKNKELASKLRVSLEEVDKIIAFITTLDPLPGRNYASEPAKYVVPDVMVKLKEGEFVLVLNEEEIPILGIDPFFMDCNSRKSGEKDVSSFVSGYLKDAKFFIKSISNRNETLLKVCKAIIEFQRDFFKKGPKYLAPLTLKDIAEEVGVHETTISRITSSKYVETEWGIFELKYFFSNPVSSSIAGGNQVSKEAAKQILKEIIEEEGVETHLTDTKLVEILQTKGVSISRRTVAKYRKELNILSSFNR